MPVTGRFARTASVMTACAVAVVVALMGASPAHAVVGGGPDNGTHSYVGYYDNGPGPVGEVYACSGTLLSPTVMLTAAHCVLPGDTAFTGTNSVTGAHLVRVSFDQDLTDIRGTAHTWWVGTYYADPQFSMTKNSITHDEAVIVFGSAGCTTPDDGLGSYRCSAVPASVTGGSYGALPALGQVDALRNASPVDVVGYGVQGFSNGGGPKQELNSYSRYLGHTTTVSAAGPRRAEFLETHSNKGGTCFGDSGGPALRAGTNTVLGITSFFTGMSNCQSDDYFYRVDTAGSQAWIRSTVAAEGGRL